MSVPKLRFQDFNEEWIIKKLGAETTWNSGGTPSKQMESYWGGDIPWISASSMRGFKYFDSDLRITEEGLSNGSKLAFKDSLLLLVRGSMLFNKIPVGIATRDVAFNQDVKSVTAKESIKPEFLLYWFLASENKLLNMVSGTGIGAGKLDTQDLLAMELCIPAIEEQTKIANFLTAVDEKITQLTQKCDLLAHYKKGVMQQIFSQELRFKDDDGRDFPEWKTLKLSKLAKIYDGTHMTPEYTETGVPFYSVEHVTSNNFKHTKYIAENIFEKENNRVILEKGDILMTRIGDIGTPKFIDWDVRASFYVSLALIKQTKAINSLYLSHFISSSFFQNELHQRTIHVAFPKKINLGEIGECLVNFPEPEEQTKIANFLTAIDDKITTTQTQLKAVKQYKQGLLQQLFV